MGWSSGRAGTPTTSTSTASESRRRPAWTPTASSRSPTEASVSWGTASSRWTSSRRPRRSGPNSTGEGGRRAGSCGCATTLRFRLGARPRWRRCPTTPCTAFATPGIARTTPMSTPATTTPRRARSPSSAAPGSSRPSRAAHRWGSPRSSTARRVAEITSVYVLPEHRGGGRGTAITRAAIEACAGAADLWIVADDEDRPKELYARLGFRPVWTVDGVPAAQPAADGD